MRASFFVSVAWLGVAAFAFMAIPGCSRDPEPTACIPGASVACTGPGGCSGAQVCNADGIAFGTCDCGGGGTDAGHDPDAGHEPDGGRDLSCDLLGQSGCESGERCAWVWEDADRSRGEPRCLPEGAVAEGGACTLDPEDFSDDCAGGSTCLGGACVRTCNADVALDACAAGSTCVVFGGFDLPAGSGGTLGFCELTCDPLTQERSDGAPACGSPNPAMPNRGCVGSTDSAFTCAPASSTRTHGQIVSPPIYLNSCAPGHLPLLLDPANNSNAICVALCRPGPTHAAGLSPHACTDKGAPGAECRYWHYLEGLGNTTEHTNTLGFCFDYADRTWDHDMDSSTAPVPLPSCTTLTDADTDGDGVPDNLAWGCVPAP